MVDECKHPGCDRPEYRIGYCTTHRSRFLRGKDMDAPRRGTVPIEDLFWAKVNKTPTCWEWTAGKSKEGYGDFWINKTMQRAHRVSYEWANGPIPDGMQVDHSCLNEGCVNPAHLRLATSALNGQNRSGPYANGTSGLRGVSWHKGSRRWMAYSTLNYKRHHIGSFATKEEAADAVAAWRRANMPYSTLDQRKENA